MTLLADRAAEHAPEVSAPVPSSTVEFAARLATFIAGMRRCHKILDRIEALDAMSDTEVIATYRPDLLTAALSDANQEKETGR